MIKNLIFDVGDVLLEYRWQDMMMDHGLSYEESFRIGKEMFKCDIWEQELDAGKITVAEAIKKYSGLYPEDGEVISWFLENAEQMVVKRPEVWEKVAQLKEMGYAVYLLSNYSEELFRKHTEGAAFLDVLDGGIISYQVHLLKPDERIYRALLEKYGLQADESLFFDDRPVNVEGARKAGIQAVQVTSRGMLNETLGVLLRPRSGSWPPV